MKITAARYEAGKLILDADTEAARFVFNFKPGEYEISKQKKKRSLDANSFAWELCTKIATLIGVSKDLVYRRAICECNQFTQLYLHPDAVADFQRVWSQKGIGWVCEVVDTDPGGMVLVFAYYGSSVYDTKAMSELIDNLVQEAKSLGIETLSERERSLLLDEWSAKKSE